MELIIEIAGWIATVLSVIAIILNARLSILGWYLWIVADLLWIIIDAYKGLYHQACFQLLHRPVHKSPQESDCGVSHWSVSCPTDISPSVRPLSPVIS